MIKKIKSLINQVKNKKEEQIKLKKLKQYYEYIRYGAEFIRYIQNDLKKASDSYNRHQRRRLQKTVLKGELTEELVNYYKEKIDQILEEINSKLK